MYRSAKTIVYYPEPSQGLVAHNYLQNKRFGCAPELVSFMRTLNSWRDAPAIAASIGVSDDQNLHQKLNGLVEAGCLIEQGTAEEARESDHTKAWVWGTPAALYHASLSGRPIVSIEQQHAMQEQKLNCDVAEHGGIFEDLAVFDIETISLPFCHLQSSLQDAIDRRRTVRDPGSEPINLTELALCLRNSMGVQTVSKNEAGAKLIFKPTPSGGAKNPFTAFVLAKSVQGLSEGVFAYDPFRHCLCRTGHQSPDFSAFLNGQDWPNNMDALIVLQADFARTMWKYHDANAYRVVLIEAGHIGQNIMLAAAACGLSACPSAAINAELAALELHEGDAIMKPAIYALGLVRPESRQ